MILISNWRGFGWVRESRLKFHCVLSATVMGAFGLLLHVDAKASETSIPQVQAGPCAAAIAYAEKARSIPVHLLQAISLTESGRWSDGHNAFIAWPWTVMAEGKGRYFKSKEAALAAVRALQTKGITNIDVGCMQVNLYYHGKNFASLEEAFDPVHNVAYATSFLMSLRHRRNSWTRAVKEYHSTKQERQTLYQKRVMSVWDALKKGHPVGGRETGIDGIGFGYLAASNWPPKDYRSQKQLEAAARARVMQYSNFN